MNASSQVGLETLLKEYVTDVIQMNQLNYECEL